MPRQRKFHADLAVINECLNELIDLVSSGRQGGPGCSMAGVVQQEPKHSWGLSRRTTVGTLGVARCP